VQSFLECYGQRVQMFIMGLSIGLHDQNMASWDAHCSTANKGETQGTSPLCFTLVGSVHRMASVEVHVNAMGASAGGVKVLHRMSLLSRRRCWCRVLNGNSRVISGNCLTSPGSYLTSRARKLPLEILTSWCRALATFDYWQAAHRGASGGARVHFGGRFVRNFRGDPRFWAQNLDQLVEDSSTRPSQVASPVDQQASYLRCLAVMDALILPSALYV
jgi:hypothetical protein